MTYLVTGGAGFMGSHYVRHLLEKEEDVIVLDAFTYAGNPDNLKEYINKENLLMPEKYTYLSSVVVNTHSFAVSPKLNAEDIKKRWQHKFSGYKISSYSSKALEKALEKFSFAVVIGNIMDQGLAKELMRYADVVVHFAAETHVDRSILNADEFIKTDIYGTYTLLEAARNSNIKRFIHISTDEVYGVATEKSFKETDPINPRNPYSASKAAADRLAHAYYVTYGVPIVILRPSNNFGPYQYPEKLIPVIITRALNDEPIPVYGDGKQIRDWLYVMDTAKAVDIAVEKGEIGQVYNIAGRNEKENIYVVKTVLNILGKPESLIKHVKDRPGHDRRYSLNDSKIRALGFKSQRFEDVIESVVKWYVDNKWWWKKILEDKNFKKFNKLWYDNL